MEGTLMTRILAGLSICILLLSVAGCAALLDDAPESLGSEEGAEAGITTLTVDPAVLLTPEDVERVSGLEGLVLAEYDPAVGAGGAVNIATADGQLVAMLVVSDLETWHGWLTDGSTVGEPLEEPVGDESFQGPSPDVSSVPYIFGFRKGEVAVAIDTFFDSNGEAVLSTEQLRELAEIVAGRL